MDHDREILLETSRFRVVRAAQNLADGGVHYREIVEHPGAVVVIPMIDEQHVCLIENYRLAVGQTLVELPAGTLDPGEDPGTTAVRELAEETGYRAAKMTPLCQFFMSPGMLDERMHLFLARGLTPGPKALEVGEQIRPRIVPWSEAMAMVLDGRIQDAKTLVGLFYYDRIRGDG
jgi:ADP-ribose pyrophosphatase